MFVLDTTTRTLEVLLDAAPAASQLPVVVTYADVDFAGANPHTLASSNTQTNGTTAVTAAAAPAAGVKRQVEELTVRNDDTAARVVTLRYNDNGTFRRIATATLQPGETLEYTHAAGLRVIADGAVKMSWAGTQIAQGGGFVRVNLDGSAEVGLAAGKNFTLDSGDLVLPAAGRLAWGTDAFLQRDGAGVLSQRNGANAQEHRVYRTYTDPSNGEWWAARWNGAVLELGAYANGTGQVRGGSLAGGPWGVNTGSPQARLHLHESAAVNFQFVLSNAGTYHTGMAFTSDPGNVFSDTHAWALVGGPNSYLSGNAYSVGVVLSSSVPDFRVMASPDVNTPGTVRYIFNRGGGLQVGGANALGGGAGPLIGLANATTDPATNPSGGGVLYASGGSLRWRGPSGTVTTIAVA